MTILARTRTVASRAHRVSPVKSTVFGLGVFATPVLTPCPIASAEAAIKAGTASCLPRTNGRGLSGAEWNRINAARNEAWYHAERHATGDDLAVAEQVGAACELATASALKAILADRPRVVVIDEPAPARRPRFEPTVEERRQAAEMFDAIERADREIALEWAACEAAASDAMTLGLIPSDLAATVARSGHAA